MNGNNNKLEYLFFAELLEEIKTIKIDTPRINVTYNFPDISTILEIYDKFVAIQEKDEETKEMKYIAIGRSIHENLRLGTLQLIDIRILDDKKLFNEAITLFKEFMNKEETISLEQKGDFSSENVLKFILDSWDLAGEIETSIIH